MKTWRGLRRQFFAPKSKVMCRAALFKKVWPLFEREPHLIRKNRRNQKKQSFYYHYTNFDPALLSDVFIY